MSLPPMDAQLSAFLTLAPPMAYAGDPVEFRAEMRRRLSVRPMTTPLPRVEDRTIPGPDGAPDLPARVYWPSDEVGLPVLVYFHGGGFCIGDIESHDGVTRKLAEQVGCVVVSVEYRLAPEHQFPAAYEDCYAAYLWVRENAAELGGDPSRVAVGGDSAGASLSAGLCLMARDRGTAQPTFQLLWYPATGLVGTDSQKANQADPLLPPDAIAWFEDMYFSRTPRERFVPYGAVALAENHTGLAPAHVVVAGHDPLHDEGVAYAAQLTAAGVPTTLDDAPTMCHGFVSFADFVPGCAEAVEGSYAALRAAFAR
ncbi:alpha/beta hydrolase [Yinghuangia seranimata]|uniref:alpha/beta hydrolase n=1 Tax=Yinghuangia seranimata TaxID=408067 RepID=UPI00248ABC69|nr:alpha/beta hydrolase [Yinghuangia seranimata]MDI2127271.1 alpha/beta hydrolase [Yinghuangia seranimata]MDI2132216.1 alpha/beta hydrolase [Yinghuangia seranimata]